MFLFQAKQQFQKIYPLLKVLGGDKGGACSVA